MTTFPKVIISTRARISHRKVKSVTKAARPGVGPGRRWGFQPRSWRCRLMDRPHQDFSSASDELSNRIMSPGLSRATPPSGLNIHPYRAPSGDVRRRPTGYWHEDRSFRHCGMPGGMATTSRGRFPSPAGTMAPGRYGRARPVGVTTRFVQNTPGLRRDQADRSIDGISSALATGDWGQGPKPRSGSPKAAALRPVSDGGTIVTAVAMITTG